ncbi:hypothetical protein O4H49_13990 [Kiloniella laminariae]|uniref:PilZ domain-containing protein n=1 Tax=Kiloniella laminariae TaxID=454162 RepID=A0ABT4LLD8_9PROT|nr:hypothetical protein [Kiloniella laminariae]MCZ4281897.1 hypothetical protein [Kiloniella laminariae]
MIKTLLDKLFGKPEVRREGREFGLIGHITLDGYTYVLENWSSSGFAVTGYRGPLLRGDRPNIEFHLQLDDTTIDFQCSAIIVRVDEEKQILAGAFVEMDKETRVKLANYFDS